MTASSKTKDSGAAASPAPAAAPAEPADTEEPQREPARYPTIGDKLAARYPDHAGGTTPALPSYLTEEERAEPKPFLAKVDAAIARFWAEVDAGIERTWRDIAEIHREHQPPAPQQQPGEQAPQDASGEPQEGAWKDAIKRELGPVDGD